MHMRHTSRCRELFMDKNGLSKNQTPWVLSNSPDSASERSEHLPDMITIDFPANRTPFSSVPFSSSAIHSYVSEPCWNQPLLMRHTAKQTRLQKSKSATGFLKRPERIWQALWILHVLVISVKLQRLGGDNARFTDIPTSMSVTHCKHIFEIQTLSNWFECILEELEQLFLRSANGLQWSEDHPRSLWNVITILHLLEIQQVFWDETFAGVLTGDLFCLLD